MNTWKYFATIAAIATTVGCSNEFDLTANWKNITVVYGLLDQSAPTQYIRVEKAFLDETTNALTIAKIADSIFYNDLTVQLQETPNNGGAGSFYTLQRIDANTIGAVKDEGTFATAPNYVYQLTQPLQENATYRLIINTANSDNNITATTRIAENFSIFNPISTQALRMEPGREVTFSWQVRPNSKFYDLKLRMRYTEAPASDPFNTTDKELVWPVALRQKPTEGQAIVTIKIAAIEFHKFLKGNLPPADNLVREVTDADIIITAGGEDLLNYIEIGLANTGITGSEIVPAYSNLSEGLGVFSTRFTKTLPNMLFSETTKDSLRLGYLTRNLGFQ